MSNRTDSVTIKVNPDPVALIAADVWPEGGKLRCSWCGHELRFTRDDAARYLGGGWPKCCGRAMWVV